jgi:hypothetical protein
MRQHKAKAVYGKSLPAPRITVWVPFLVAMGLSAPVALITLVIAILK